MTGIHFDASFQLVVVYSASFTQLPLVTSGGGADGFSETSGGVQGAFSSWRWEIYEFGVALNAASDPDFTPCSDWLVDPPQ